MTMKYLGIILKIVRNSYLEALQCQESSNDDSNKFEHSGPFVNPSSVSTYKNPKLDVYKRSMIEEENEEDSDEDNDDAFTKNANRASK
jgi:hypothetical protein